MGRQSDPNVRHTLVHVGPTMGGALIKNARKAAVRKMTQMPTLASASQSLNIMTKRDIQS